jgi:2-phosphosulfolactate phosphatase
MRISIEQGIDGAKLAVSRHDSVIIVDTIRASTTYVNAFASGALRIVPCSSREHLNEKFKDYPDALRSGERLCQKIEGYDLGSSPEEMSKANLEGQIILSSTTNGSKMVVASAGSPIVVMGTFCNCSAVVNFLVKKGGDVTIVCSGRLGEAVIEDTICAEYIKHKFVNPITPFRLSDIQISDKCRVSPSYKMLESAGLEKDFNYCMDIDSHSLVPILKDDGFILI